MTDTKRLLFDESHLQYPSLTIGAESYNKPYNDGIIYHQNQPPIQNINPQYPQNTPQPYNSKPFSSLSSQENQQSKPNIYTHNYDLNPYPSSSSGQNFYKKYGTEAGVEAGPMIFRCPNCSYEGETVYKSKTGNVTFGWCIGMLLFSGCCWIPFFVDSCKDKEHFCMKCNIKAGDQKASCC